MKIAWLAFLLTFSLSAGAQPARPDRSVAADPGTKALQAPLKIDREQVRKNIPVPPSRNELDRDWDDFRSKYDRTLKAIKEYEQVSASCTSRSYSIEDQRKAGCRGSDAIDTCSNKLYKACVKDSEMAMSTVWTDMGMRAASLRKKLLDFSNSPRELRKK